MKIYFYTFGCKVNQYDTQSIKERILRRTGDAIEVDNPSAADVILINTCTVTAEADRQCRQMARRFLRLSRARIIFYGCYVRRARGVSAQESDDFEKEYGDKIIFAASPAEVERILDATDASLPHPSHYGTAQRSSGDGAITSFGDERSRAYVKIQDGCDQFCSYCIVPYVRNDMISRTPDDVLREINNLVDNGYAEIVLCGVRLGRYSPNDGYKLENLVGDILKLRDDFRIRFSSIEVLEISEGLVELMKKYPSRICRHLHIPLQSGSDTILKKMNRPYTAREYEKKVLQLKKELEPLAVTTDVIIGFPGETEEDFELTHSLARRIEFSKLHIFPYSPRPGTAASKMNYKKDAGYLKALSQRKKAMFGLNDFLQKKWREASMKREHLAVYIGDGWVLTEDYQYYRLVSYSPKNSGDRPQGIFKFNPSMDAIG